MSMASVSFVELFRANAESVYLPTSITVGGLTFAGVTTRLDLEFLYLEGVVLGAGERVEVELRMSDGRRYHAAGWVASAAGTRAVVSVDQRGRNALCDVMCALA